MFCVENNKIMLKAFKYRIYPNVEQEIILAKHFGSCRFLYNWGLAKKIELYQKESKKISCFDLIKEITQLKKEKEYEWLNEINAQSLQQSLRHLDNAFTRFFREKKGFPKFHKKTGKQSFAVPQSVKIDFEKNQIQIPKCKQINVKLHRKFEGNVKTCVISKNPSGKYFISVLVENNENLPQKAEIKSETAVGIDVGIKDFATLSNGEVIANPRHLKSKEIKLAKHQKRLARKKKGSKRRELQKKRVAKIYEKISNERRDFLHKTSKKIVQEFDTVITENLNVKGMVKNHNLAKAISDCSWGTFTSMLEYKCNWYGKNYIKIGRFEPSSKLCSCGVINKELRLSDRVWTCKVCNATHDRDRLASQNIKTFGLQKQNLIQAI
jgi:putative transposase